MRSSNIKHAIYLLDFLAPRPLRWLVNIGFFFLLIGIALALIPHGDRNTGTRPTADRPIITNIAALAQRIADAHLFGQAPGQASDANAALPTTEIKVQGLLYSDDPAAALAILEMNGNSGFFRVGDVLPDGEKLAAIAPTAIELTQGMAQRVVELPEQFGGPGDGILLAGDTGLGPKGPHFPGVDMSTGAQSYKPALRPVSLRQGASPLEQMRALREQLISH